MPPPVSAYQEAARSIYEPQKQAETIALTANRDTTKAALEAQKGQVNTDYEDAIMTLTHAVQDQTGQINQLYSQRLGGNFSGLQGNDLGQMFARANEQTATIAKTRANKLGEITTGQTNADINYGAGIASLTPKYQSLETEYANNAYGAAVKDYKDTQYKNAQLSLSYARLNASNANKDAAKFKVSGKLNSDTGKVDMSKGYSFTGPNDQPISLAEFVAGSGKGVDDVLSLLQNGSSYDQAIYRQVKAAGISRSPQAIIDLIAKEDSKNYYGFR